jgi:signal transduction histidine kinase
MATMAKSRRRGGAKDTAALDAVLDAVPAALARLDRAGRVVSINRFWREVAHDSGFIGSNVGVGEDYVEACRGAPDGDRRIARGVADILADRRSGFEIEYSHISPGRRPRWFRCVVSPTHGGGRQGAVVAHLDVTDAALAKQEHAALDSFASGVAHDLNSLLLGMAGLLDATIADGSDRSARLRAMREVVEHAGVLVRQFSAFARHDRVLRTRVDLADAIGRALDILCAILPPNIALERELETVGETIADPVQLQQIMLNLGTNAVDASSGAEGRIRVTLQRVSTRDLAAGLKRSPHARLRFTDNGAGIPPEIIGRIFEPFFTTRNENGRTGMGLAVVQGIIARHGGRIEVKSVPGKGTELTIWLPLARPAREILNRAVSRTR